MRDPLNVWTVLVLPMIIGLPFYCGFDWRTALPIHGGLVFLWWLIAQRLDEWEYLLPPLILAAMLAILVPAVGKIRAQHDLRKQQRQQRPQPTPPSRPASAPAFANPQ